MSRNFNVVVIGGGPAGYVAAIRAAQNGLAVACIDEWINRDGSAAFGGTCLNAGCIPSKALLESSELYHRAEVEFAAHGIKTGGLDLDLTRMQERKMGIVKQLTGGIEALFKANKVTGLKGHGRLLAGREVEFVAHDGKTETLRADHVILASGSTPIELKSCPFDGERIVDSWSALDFDAVPMRLGVIGAGIVGLELGSVWRRLGAEVTMLEAMDQFLFFVDHQIAKDAMRHFKKQGLDIRLGAMVEGAKVTQSGVKVSYKDSKGKQEIEVDRLIVAVGRRPNTDGLLADDTGISLDGRGFIQVDEECRTGVENIWAIGDVVRGPMLAHKGSEEGVMVAQLIVGEIAEVNYAAIPSVLYTAPEIAWVGKTEQEVKEAGVAYKTGTFSFMANGRAKAMQQTGGLVKIISSTDDDAILGVHIIGPYAGELIAEAVLALEYSASTEDIQRTIHAHPSLSEAVHEAALAVDKKAIHAINK